MEVYAEFIKHVDITLHKLAVDILNEVAVTDNYPDELKTSIPTPLQKANKKQKSGALFFNPLEYIRPISLSSVCGKD